jgi:hypothetical protein
MGCGQHRHRHRVRGRSPVIENRAVATRTRGRGVEISIGHAGESHVREGLVVITLDGAALRAEAGQKVADELGRALKGTSTGVILGSVGIDLRSWFLQQSGLAADQVTNGVLALLAYEVPPSTMPLHPGVDPDLLSTSDYAYGHVSAVGFSVDDSAPEVAQRFSDLYNRSQVSQCSVTAADQYRVSVAVFPVLAAWELLGWPPAADIEAADPTWQLRIEATREFQQLGAFGPAGRAAAEQTSAEGILEYFRSMERDVVPMDLARSTPITTAARSTTRTTRSCVRR